MSEEEIKSMFDSIPKVETNNCISAYGSINIEDIKSAMKRLNKVPDYNDLLKENKELKDKYLEAVDNYEQVNFKNIQAIEFVKTEHNTYPSAEEWRQALINILEGDK